MKGLEIAYELKIRKEGWSGYLQKKRGNSGLETTLHIVAKGRKQAESKAVGQAEKRNAHIVSLTKMDMERGLYGVENMRIELDVPHQNAIAMDELIKVKRNKRRDNLDRDKPLDFQQ